jgi:hypothetical protein
VTVLGRPAGRLRALLFLASVGLLAACGATAPTSASPASGTAFAPTPGPSIGSAGPDATATTLSHPPLTPVPGAPSVTPGTRPTPVPTTMVSGFGPILDTVPPSFPRLAGQEPADPGTGPTSGTYVVTMSADAASDAMRTGLEGRGWSVDVGSPLEDGTVVLDATGATTGCRAEVRFTPQGATLVVAVLYGAGCPTT